ncbi:MAG TPA: 2-hydroxyacid dehydrogenase [Gemmatales bacterium]|nr:2-hydroxyacid dehydrogenase [Gemmatales bacterium]HMP58905.1 2-hydroxyacid dehydrogenase [Gemmatales bacterium]
MKVALFDTRQYDRQGFTAANAQRGHELVFFEERLTARTAVLAQGCPVVVSFVNDVVDAAALEELKRNGVQLLALRCAGWNHVDVAAAHRLQIPVVRVPAYSPEAVAEHAVALLLTLNRKIHRAFNRVRESNFSLDGLVGFNVHGSTVGVVGTGQIGVAFARIMAGFGTRLLGFDVYPNQDLARQIGLQYVPLEELLATSDVVSLHCPLTPQTHHLINADALSRMRPRVVILNTGRGGLIDTRALIQALKESRIGGAALDVYEEEAGVFFQDLSGEVLQDDVLARLLTFPNVLVTSHQGFLTHEALNAIAATTLDNVTALESGRPLQHLLTL